MIDKEQETAMYDQPDADESADPNSIWERIRALGREEGWEFGTITLTGMDVDVRVNDSPSLPVTGQNVSDFGKKVLGFLEGAGATYKERNAIYQDNFRVVGRVLEALFPNGAPSLHDATDYNRWHIFELVIVKLTRYVANWSNPDADSLVDMLPYLSILAAQDQEVREALAKEIEDQIEQNRLMLKLKQTARGAGLFVDGRSDPMVPSVRNEAELYAEDDSFDMGFRD